MGGSVINFRAFNPRQNLPQHLSRKRGESNFVGAFERAFTADTGRDGVGGRHFSLSGYGIADFVWVDSPVPADSGESAWAGTVTAFEMKLHDWRRALTQAYRYSYFADYAVVVLPPETAGNAAARLDIFKALNIGLWTFDPKTTAIHALHESRRAEPRNAAAKAKAMALFGRSTKFRELLK